MTPEQRDKVRKVLGIPVEQVDDWDKDTLIEELSDVALMLDSEEHIEEVAHFKTRIRTLEMQLRSAKAEVAQLERDIQRPPAAPAAAEPEEEKSKKEAAEEEPAPEKPSKRKTKSKDASDVDAGLGDLEAQLAASLAANANLQSENAALQNLIDEGVELHDKQEAEMKAFKARLDEAGL